MPIYEYQCQACGKHFEEMQKMSDSALVNCPDCGKPQLKRLISHTSFQLKGGGYYATDYKTPLKKDDKPAADKENKPANKDESTKKSTELKETESKDNASKKTTTETKKE